MSYLRLSQEDYVEFSAPVLRRKNHSVSFTVPQHLAAQLQLENGEVLKIAILGLRERKMTKMTKMTSEVIAQ